MSPRSKAILALLMVFAAGLAGGTLLEDIVDDIERPVFAADDDDDDDLSEETILANVDLTPAQRASIERVFEIREDRLESYWDAQFPHLAALIDSSRAEIRGSHPGAASHLRQPTHATQGSRAPRAERGLR